MGKQATKRTKGMPLSVMERILREAGAERVAAGAKKELQEQLDAQAKDIASRAVARSRHAGRKTVVAEDVRQTRR